MLHNYTMTLNVVKFTSNMNGSVPFGIGTWPACSRRDAYLDSSKGVMYPSGNGFKSIDLEKKRTTNCRSLNKRKKLYRDLYSTLMEIQ